MHGIATETASLLTKIVSENMVAADLEITTEILVTADVWNRQHDLRIISIAKIY